MSKLKYLTIKHYAKVWLRHENSIRNRIAEGKLLAISEPGSGRGILIPVCECEDNHFPGRSLCINCKRGFEAPNK